MAHLAFLGTGLLGGAFAEAAAKRGDTVVVWNRSPEKAHALEPFGVTVAGTPEAAVRGAERVHLVLRDDPVVDDVIEACGAALRGIAVFDHTTNAPVATAARVARLDAAGIPYVHAPVFMGPPAARDAKGLMLASGAAHKIEPHREALARMTGRFHVLGERPDLAAVYKLMGNAMLVAITAGLADMHGIGAAGGLSAQESHALFALFDPAAMIHGRGARLAEGDYTASFELSMARKDVQLMLDTATHGEQMLHLLPAVAARMDALLANGHASDDMSVLAVDAVPKRA